MQNTINFKLTLLYSQQAKDSGITAYVKSGDTIL